MKIVKNIQNIDADIMISAPSLFNGNLDFKVRKYLNRVYRSKNPNIDTDTPRIHISYITILLNTSGFSSWTHNGSTTAISRVGIVIE